MVLAAPAQAATKFNTPTNSSPIVLSADGKLLWSVNPDNNSVVAVNTKNNTVLKTINVGAEPAQIAVDPRNEYVYVANAADASVTVIRILNANPKKFNAKVARDLGTKGTFTTGSEPTNIVASPDGRRIYVSNSSQDTISVIDATERFKGKGRKQKQVSPTLLGSVVLRGSACSPDPEFHFQPRGLAVTKNNKQLYVTSFFSFQLPGTQQVNDQGRQGIVCRIDLNTKSQKLKQGAKPIGRIGLAAQNTGFQIDKTLDNVPDPTFAWPNQLQSIVINQNRAYLPNIAASPEGPLRFNVDTQSFLSIIDGVNTPAQTDAGSINMHLGARTPEVGKKKLFFANPWAIDFQNQSGGGAVYVVSAGSDLLVKLRQEPDGSVVFTNNETTTRYIDLNDPENPATAGANAGKNPRGHRDERQRRHGLRDEFRLAQHLRHRHDHRHRRRRDPDGTAAGARIAGGSPPGRRRGLLQLPRPLQPARRDDGLDRRATLQRRLAVLRELPLRRAHRQRRLGVRRRAA